MATAVLTCTTVRDFLVQGWHHWQARLTNPWRETARSRVAPPLHVEATAGVAASEAADATQMLLGAIDRIPRPRLGYLGPFTSGHVDLTLLRSIAQARPVWSVVLVGARPNAEPRGRLGGVPWPPNAHVLDPVPGDLAAAVIDRLDVALMPLNERAPADALPTRLVLECLGRGCPVVSRPSPALEPLRRRVRQAETTDDWVLAIHAALGV